MFKERSLEVFRATTHTALAGAMGLSLSGWSHERSTFESVTGRMFDFKGLKDRVIQEHTAGKSEPSSRTEARTAALTEADVFHAVESLRRHGAANLLRVSEALKMTPEKFYFYLAKWKRFLAYFGIQVNLSGEHIREAAAYLRARKRVPTYERTARVMGLDDPEKLRRFLLTLEYKPRTYGLRVKPPKITDKLLRVAAGDLKEAICLPTLRHVCALLGIDRDMLRNYLERKIRGKKKSYRELGMFHDDISDENIHAAVNMLMTAGERPTRKLVSVVLRKSWFHIGRHIRHQKSKPEACCL